MLDGNILPQSLNTKIREQMVQGFSITEPSKSSCSHAVFTLTPRPEPYLASILEDSNLRLYVKLNALTCLGEIHSPESKNRLEGIGLHPNLHPMLRRSAFHSYIKQLPDSERSKLDPSFGGRLMEREYLEFVKQVVVREARHPKMQEKKIQRTHTAIEQNRHKSPDFQERLENPTRR